MGLQRRGESPDCFWHRCQCPPGIAKVDQLIFAQRWLAFKKRDHVSLLQSGLYRLPTWYIEKEVERCFEALCRNGWQAPVSVLLLRLDRLTQTTGLLPVPERSMVELLRRRWRAERPYTRAPQLGSRGTARW